MVYMSQLGFHVPSVTSNLPGLPMYRIDGLEQDCCNSGALAMELLQSCIKPSICCHTYWIEQTLLQNYLTIHDLTIVP